jgi:hypothetical protein
VCNNNNRVYIYICEEEEEKVVVVAPLSDLCATGRFVEEEKKTVKFVVVAVGPMRMCHHFPRRVFNQHVVNYPNWNVNRKYLISTPHTQTHTHI